MEAAQLSVKAGALMTANVLFVCLVSSWVQADHSEFA